MFTYLSYLLTVGAVMSQNMLLKLERVSGADHGMDGLGCAIEMVRSGLSMAVRYDVGTRTCEPVTESEVEQSSRYIVYKLRYIRAPCPEQHNNFAVQLPQTIRAGSSFIFNLEKGAIDGSYITFDLRNRQSVRGFVICLHFKVRYYENQVAIDYAHDGRWQNTQFAPMIMQMPNIYKLEFRIKDSTIEIYLDDQLYYTFQYGIPIEKCHIIQYIRSDTEMTCLEMERIYEE